MSVRTVLTYPDAALSTVCPPVEAVSADIEALADDMLETMYDAPGRGLAAPQIGVALRLFVMDVTWKEGTYAPIIFINPRIVGSSDTIVTQPEGCLSIPGVSVEVKRPDAVHVQWTDLNGQPREQTFEGFAAACVQHEIDHLDGVLTLDRVDAETRARVIQDYSGAHA